MILQVFPTVSTGATVSTQMFAFEPVYASCLVAFGASTGTSTAYGTAGYNLDALGNELR